jgi:hypothetical protein
LQHPTAAASAEFKALMRRLSQCEHSRRQVTNPLWLAAPRDRHVAGAIREERTAIESKALRKVQTGETARLKAMADDIGKVADAIIPFMRRHFGSRRRQK